MSALTLMIIRHAEKPGGEFAGNGFNENSEGDKKSLVVRGWRRAGAWATLFGSPRGGSDYPTPNFIYAATPGGRDNTGASNRPAETVAPLGAKLGIPVKTEHAQGAEAALMKEVLGLSGNVLICWEHQATITAILPRIPTVKGKLPENWNGDRFDAVLRLGGSSPSGPFAIASSIPLFLPETRQLRLDKRRAAVLRMPREGSSGRAPAYEAIRSIGRQWTGDRVHLLASWVGPARSSVAGFRIFAKKLLQKAFSQRLHYCF
jgi:hypothetical protein